MSGVLTKSLGSSKKTLPLPRDIDVISVLSFAKDIDCCDEYRMLACMILDMQKNNAWRTIKVFDKKDSLFLGFDPDIEYLLKSTLKEFLEFDELSRNELNFRLREKAIINLAEQFPRERVLSGRSNPKELTTNEVLPCDFSTTDLLKYFRTDFDIDMAIFLIHSQEDNQWIRDYLNIDGKSISLEEILKLISHCAKSDLIRYASDHAINLDEALEEKELLVDVAETTVKIFSNTSFCSDNFSAKIHKLEDNEGMVVKLFCRKFNYHLCVVKKIGSRAYFLAKKGPKDKGYILIDNLNDYFFQKSILPELVGLLREYGQSEEELVTRQR